MTDPKDTTIEVLCSIVTQLRNAHSNLSKVSDGLRAHHVEIEREREEYRDENEKLRAMVAEFRRRIGLSDVYSPAMQVAPQEVVLACLDDCERVAFAETSET
jgi:hypothetical protein